MAAHDVGMDQRVPLNELDDALDELEYPLSRVAAADRCAGVTLELADGEKPLDDLIEGSNQDTFGSEDELANEVRNLLPRRAVGEPYQSEGEG